MRKTAILTLLIGVIVVIGVIATHITVDFEEDDKHRVQPPDDDDTWWDLRAGFHTMNGTEEPHGIQNNI